MTVLQSQATTTTYSTTTSRASSVKDDGDDLVACDERSFGSPSSSETSAPSSAAPSSSVALKSPSNPDHRHDGSCTPPLKKRPRTTIDVLDRLADRKHEDDERSPSSKATTTIAPVDLQSGRGCLTGWVTCPLCVPVSRKRYALGRGIATHLQTVHQPWNPGKVERKRRMRLKERRAAKARQGESSLDCPKATAATTAAIQKEEDEKDREEDRTCWEPTQHEVDAWKTEMLQLLQRIEAAAAAAATGGAAPATPSGRTDSHSMDGALSVTVLPAGTDRKGDAAVQYRQSLPDFLQAAADGNLAGLKTMLVEAQANGGAEAVRALLHTRDRHLSTADHWAAGSGNVECLRFLVEARNGFPPPSHSEEVGAAPSAPPKLRRRDGKTALHYAARNGHTETIRYLLCEAHHPVDEASGDGTTPLHLACFGGHAHAFELLVDHGADPHRRNDWGCTAAHWIAMTKSQSKDEVWSFCKELQRRGVSFADKQMQGHTALHKAAQRKNRLVVEWMAGSEADGGAGLPESELRAAGMPDAGGHTPSEIWLSVKGDKDFAEWMRRKMQW